MSRGFERFARRRQIGRWHERCFVSNFVRVSRVVCGVVFLCAGSLGAPGLAHAQNAVIMSSPVSDGGVGSINYADCAGGNTLSFTLAVTNPSAGDTFQVWAGPPTSSSLGCIPSAARQSGGVCWPLADPTAAVASTVSVPVRARDIANYLGSAPLPTTYSGANGSGDDGVESAVNSAGLMACQQQAIPGPVSLGIYFLLVESDGMTVDGDFAAHEGGAEYTFQAGTLGPQAPESVSVVINDESATLAWTPPSDTSIVGYNVYCQDYGAIDAATPPASSGESLDTGINEVDGGVAAGECGGSALTDTGFTKQVVSTTTTTDSSTTSTTDSGTDSADLVSQSGTVGTQVTTPAGISQVPIGKVGNTIVSLCASPNGAGEVALTAGSTASTATLTLTNYDYYVFAVAAVDALGNVGPVGNVQCGTPGPIQDFWLDYTQDGGLAGGGYCALQGVGMPAGGTCMGIGVGFVALSLVRRRRAWRGTRRPGRVRSCPRR